MLSQGCVIMVQLTSLLKPSVDYWGISSLEAKRRELLDVVTDPRVIMIDDIAQ